MAIDPAPLSDPFSLPPGETPLGIRHPLGQSWLQPKFLTPLGGRSLTVLDPSVFNTLQTAGADWQSPFQDSPFFDRPAPGKPPAAATPAPPALQRQIMGDVAIDPDPPPPRHPNQADLDLIPSAEESQEPLSSLPQSPQADATELSPVDRPDASPELPDRSSELAPQIATVDSPLGSESNAQKAAASEPAIQPQLETTDISASDRPGETFSPASNVVPVQLQSSSQSEHASEDNRLPEPLNSVSPTAAAQLQSASEIGEVNEGDRASELAIPQQSITDNQPVSNQPAQPASSIEASTPNQLSQTTESTVQRHELTQPVPTVNPPQEVRNLSQDSEGWRDVKNLPPAEALISTEVSTESELPSRSTEPTIQTQQDLDAPAEAPVEVDSLAQSGDSDRKSTDFTIQTQIESEPSAEASVAIDPERREIPSSQPVAEQTATESRIERQDEAVSLETPLESAHSTPPASLQPSTGVDSPPAVARKSLPNSPDSSSQNQPSSTHLSALGDRLPSLDPDRANSGDLPLSDAPASPEEQSLLQPSGQAGNHSENSQLNNSSALPEMQALLQTPDQDGDSSEAMHPQNESEATLPESDNGQASSLVENSLEASDQVSTIAPSLSQVQAESLTAIPSVENQLAQPKEITQVSELGSSSQLDPPSAIEKIAQPKIQLKTELPQATLDISSPADISESASAIAQPQPQSQTTLDTSSPADVSESATKIAQSQSQTTLDTSNSADLSELTSGIAQSHSQINLSPLSGDVSSSVNVSESTSAIAQPKSQSQTDLSSLSPDTSNPADVSTRAIAQPQSQTDLSPPDLSLLSGDISSSINVSESTSESAQPQTRSQTDLSSPSANTSISADLSNSTSAIAQPQSQIDLFSLPPDTSGSADVSNSEIVQPQPQSPIDLSPLPEDISSSVNISELASESVQSQTRSQTDLSNSTSAIAQPQSQTGLSSLPPDTSDSADVSEQTSEIVQPQPQSQTDLSSLPPETSSSEALSNPISAIAQPQSQINLKTALSDIAVSTDSSEPASGPTPPQSQPQTQTQINLSSLPSNTSNSTNLSEPPQAIPQPSELDVSGFVNSSESTTQPAIQLKSNASELDENPFPASERAQSEGLASPPAVVPIESAIAHPPSAPTSLQSQTEQSQTEQSQTDHSSQPELSEAITAATEPETSPPEVAQIPALPTVLQRLSVWEPLAQLKPLESRPAKSLSAQLARSAEPTHSTADLLPPAQLERSPEPDNLTADLFAVPTIPNPRQESDISVQRKRMPNIPGQTRDRTAPSPIPANATAPDEWGSVADLFAQMREESGFEPEARSTTDSKGDYSESDYSENGYSDLHPYPEASVSEARIQRKSDPSLPSSVPPDPAVPPQEQPSSQQAPAKASPEQLEQLAQEIYRLLRQRLAIEQERAGKPYSGRLL